VSIVSEVLFVRRMRALGAMLVAAMLVAGLGACGERQAPGPAAPATPAAIPVSVIEASPRRVPVAIDVVGQASGSREIEVRARVSGILERRLYEEGSAVRAGAELFQIDRRPFEITLDQARANLQQAQARRDQARREAQRLKPLADERAVSRKESDDAASLLEQSEAALALAEAQVRDATLNLSYTSVTAPIGGVSGRSLRSEGTLVSAGTDSALLTTVVQTDPVWVLFSVSQGEYEVIRAAGKLARVQLLKADGTPARASGRINFTASTVDARLSTVQLRGEFANADRQWLPGQFVRVRVLAGEQTAFLVPQSAVVQNELNRTVWVIDAAGKAASRVVKTGAWSGADWVVTGGLSTGDRVIIDNLMKLRSGTAVQPQSR
jgi:membrane fusion protein (multidrug efflux system)